MSIEQFHEGYPADNNFIKDISKNPDYGHLSPVGLMAKIYINEGSHGLSQYIYTFARKYESGTLKLSREEDESYVINVSGIYFGASLTVIEDAIINGYLDQYKFNSIIENSFSSFRKPILFPDPEYEELGHNQHKNLTKIATEDKTFLSFFDDRVDILPESLAKVIDNSALFKHIDYYILPEYLERVSMLIDANEERILFENTKR